MPLPTPSGPYDIGSITHELVDESRPVHLASEAPGRHLLLKAWYPATSAAIPTELLWAELRGDARTPLSMRLLLRCLRARTASMPRASISPLVAASPLVIYNHGLISFAAENTSLMEELASHGYTVLAVQHADQFPELRALNRRQSDDERRAHEALEQQLKAASADRRAELVLQQYERAGQTNRIAIERAADTSFVMRNATAALAVIPGLQPHSIDASSAHFVGFSLGGAVATATAERDSRVRSVTNLDGGLYGTRNARQIRAPYLMMYSSANGGINDTMLPDHAERVTAAGTTHLNYHDVAGLLPVLRYVRATGSAAGDAFLVRRNATVRAFVTASG